MGEEPGEVVVAETGVELHRGGEVAQERGHWLLLDAEEGEALEGSLSSRTRSVPLGSFSPSSWSGSSLPSLAEKAQAQGDVEGKLPGLARRGRGALAHLRV